MLFVLALGAAIGAAHASDCAPDETDPTAIGSGTPSDPWQVCTAAQLRSIGQQPAGHFELVDDIDLDGWPGSIGPSCTPHPTSGGFAGSLIGNGHTLSNHVSDRGLFSCIHGGVVEDLHLENVEVTNKNRRYGVGGLFGFMNGGQVSDVTVTGTVRSDGYGAGGIGGVSYDSEIERVSFDGEVWGTHNVGGIVGNLVRTDITDCAAIGNVSGRLNLGGLVGLWTSVPVRSDLRRCVSAVTVRDRGAFEDPRLGLLVGKDQGVILGSDGEESWDAVFALASGDTPLIGTSSYVNGTAIAAGREILLDPMSYERAGWDLETVWTEPTPTSLPQLR